MYEQNDFIAKCEAAAQGPNPVDVIKSLMTSAVADGDTIAGAFAHIEDEEYLIHASEHITFVHIRLTPNVHFPPHDHLMNAVIGVYRGEETHVFYDRTGSTVVAKGNQTFDQGSVVSIDVNGIHSVANTSETRGAALHIYIGNLLEQHRSIWDVERKIEHPYSDEKYFTLACSFDQSKPFEQPAVSYAHSTDR